MNEDLLQLGYWSKKLIKMTVAFHMLKQGAKFIFHWSVYLAHTNIFIEWNIGCKTHILQNKTPKVQLWQDSPSGTLRWPAVPAPCLTLPQRLASQSSFRNGCQSSSLSAGSSQDFSDALKQQEGSWDPRPGLLLCLSLKIHHFQG